MQIKKIAIIALKYLFLIFFVVAMIAFLYGVWVLTHF